jgi:hypothetical protein
MTATSSRVQVQYYELQNSWAGGRPFVLRSEYSKFCRNLQKSTKIGVACQDNMDFSARCVGLIILKMYSEALLQMCSDGTLRNYRTIVCETY